MKITRTEQDSWAFLSFERALSARAAGRLNAELVALRHNAEEMRDQSAVEVDSDDFADMTPFTPPDGTTTPGNTSPLHDGAAFTVVVSEGVWRELGCPAGLRVAGALAAGVTPQDEARAAAVAAAKLLERNQSLDRAALKAIEIGERSAAEAIAFCRAMNVDPQSVNSDGGAIARGHPLGASGAVLVVRLFARMVRNEGAGTRPHFGLAALGAAGGLGAAMVLERV